jgi:hypothetical protein
MDGIMFAVDGQQRFALTAGFGGNQLTGGDQALFISQANGLARAHGFVSGFESGYAHNGADDEIGFRVSRDLHRSRGAVNHFDFVCSRGF